MKVIREIVEFFHGKNQRRALVPITVEDLLMIDFEIIKENKSGTVCFSPAEMLTPKRMVTIFQDLIVSSANSKIIKVPPKPSLKHDQVFVYEGKKPTIKRLRSWEDGLAWRFISKKSDLARSNNKIYKCETYQLIEDKNNDKDLSNFKRKVYFEKNQLTNKYEKYVIINYYKEVKELPKAQPEKPQSTKNFVYEKDWKEKEIRAKLEKEIQEKEERVVYHDAKVRFCCFKCRLPVNQ